MKISKRMLNRIFLTFSIALLIIHILCSLSQAVYRCGTETDDCYCGVNNPYSCCDNDFNDCGGTCFPCSNCNDGCDGNCTWWAWEKACCDWRVALPGWGNAGSWATDAMGSGYLVNNMPAKYTIAVSSYYGHVAWVQQVSSDRSTIWVSEMNCFCDGRCSNPDNPNISVRENKAYSVATWLQSGGGFIYPPLIHAQGHFISPYGTDYGNDPVFLLQNGTYYHIVSSEILNMMEHPNLPRWRWDRVKDVPADTLKKILDDQDYIEGPEFITTDVSSNGFLIRQVGTDPVYLVWNGEKRWIRSADVLQWNGKDWWPDVIEVTASIASMFSSGYDLYAIGKDASSGAEESIINAYHRNEDNTCSGYPGPYCSYLLFATSPVHDALPSDCSGITITGKYQRFEYSDNTYGAINWTNEYGAFEFHGAIGNRYKDEGFSGSPLGFPTSDEYQWGSYRRNDFECGYIYWNPSTDLTYVVYTNDVREIDEGESPPSDFVLFQNYPNPFNPTTNIEFLLPRSGQVTIEIFNILGQKVRTLVDQHLKAGHKLVDWDGKDDSGKEVSSGIYFYQIKTSEFLQTKKMVLLR